MLKDIPNIILLSGVFISVSVANVQLTTSSIVNGSPIAICNSTVTYTCLIKSYTLMFFLIDDIRVATCAELFCTQFQAMPSNADFTYNTAAGLFNLTFNDIKRKDTGNVIKCSDGTSKNDKEITQNIKDYTVSFKEVSGPTGYELKIVTGCISNTTKLSFVWNMIPANSSDVKVYTGKTKTMPLDTISCLHNPDCGSSESVKRGNIVSITKTEGGSNYYIQSIVVFLEANISYSVKTNFQRMYVISGEISSGPFIHPDQHDEIENSSVSFRCSTKDKTSQIISWTTESKENICSFNQTCGNMLTQSRNGSYNCNCLNSNNDELILDLEIQNITKDDHCSMWICEVITTSSILAKSALLFVKVPVKSIEIMPANKMLQLSENSSYQFTCTTSRGRPVPKIKWIVSEETDDTNYLMFEGNQTSSNKTSEHKMLNANSTFLYMVDRIVNGWKIFCSVEETGIQSRVNSDAIILNITYPPDSRLMINGLFKEGIYKVIENSTGTLNCTVKGGNPQPTLSWSKCFGTDQSSVEFENASTETYSSVFMWKAISNTDMKCSCLCMHKEQNQSLSINVEILYPPILPSISFGNQIITGNISVIINTSLPLNCTSDSRPVSTYRWRFNDEKLSERQQHIIIQSNKADYGQYTCEATNIMDPTDGSEQMTSKTKSFELHVLYPPTIHTMEDMNVLEGAPLNFLCPVIPGNPSDTQIVWTTADEAGVGEKFLEISNISRKHDRKYTCTVNNTMLPTFGAEKQGRNSKSFHLNVEYLATITAFYVEGYEQQCNITVNEADSLTFICRVESKPVSSTSIYVQTGKTLSVSESNYISYNIHSAMCQHTDAYVCSGRNEHNNNQVSNRTLFVFINCSPRIDHRYPVKESVAVSLNEPVLLSLTALAYPIPTDVSWQKHNGYVWTDIIVTNNIKIRRSHLNYSLIIDSIQEDNFGMYKLIIANEKGSYEQIFHINAAGINPSANIEKTNTMVIVIGSVSGIIGVAFIITILVWILKKRRSKKEHKGIRMPPRISFKESLVRHTALEMEHLQEIDDAPFVLTEHTEYYNSIQKIEKIDKIKVSELYQYVIGRDEDDFAIEYQNIPTDLQKPYNFATKPDNLALNRYNGIFPYDHSRVKIHAIPDFFMNACYIDGFERQHAYIASLGPTEKTTNHFITFWQMVWFEKSDVIVMLTNLVEPSRMKCEQYWPEADAKVIYGDICVNSKRLETFAEYTVREFEISRKQEKRCVIQLHFTAWPDKTVPEDVTSLIEFRQRVIQTPTDSSGPVIVHCSAGIGRTGTFIALDRLIREGQKTNEINVFECVQNMRQQRVKMVQTLEQYVYIYKALVTALTFDSEVIPLSSLHEFTEGTSNNEYSRLFQQLNQTVEAVKEDEQLAVRRNENQTKKNRVGADIPGKMFRVYLRLRRKQNDSDYINAVFINSFTKPNNFIMAQSPLPLTVEDFVSMIYQDDCICVVSLDDRNESRMSAGQYIPEGKQKLTFGSFRVSSSLLQTERYSVLKKLTISYDDKPNSGAKIVYHYQYTQWLEEMRIPECTEDFVHFVSEVQRKAREHGRKKFHIIVHCLMANERSGLFCALAIIFDKLKLEGQVSMMNTLRHLRTRRRTAILSVEQLRFCFEAASIFAGFESNK